MAASSSTASFSNKNQCYDVFLSYCRVDTKETFARSLYLRLLNHGLRTFLDKPEMQPGYEIDSQIKNAIRTASVHVAILSPRYAESTWCLDELLEMLESHRAKTVPIIPVYYGVTPAEVRWTRGRYAEALEELAEKRTREGELRYDPNMIENWRNALSQVADISGFELRECDIGEELEVKLLDELVEHMSERMKKTDLRYDVYLSHRGVDTKETFARSLYLRLLQHGLRPFLDKHEMQPGYEIASQLKNAIRTASVHVAILSAGYAESPWCLNDLLEILESKAHIIPVFYRVTPSEVRRTRGRYAEALQKLAEKRTREGEPRYDFNMIKNWRNALYQVTNISGFELRECDIGEEPEVKLLDELVKHMSERMKKPDLHLKDCISICV